MPSFGFLILSRLGPSLVGKYPAISSFLLDEDFKSFVHAQSPVTVTWGSVHCRSDKKPVER